MLDLLKNLQYYTNFNSIDSHKEKKLWHWPSWLCLKFYIAWLDKVEDYWTLNQENEWQIVMVPLDFGNIDSLEEKRTIMSVTVQEEFLYSLDWVF